jgi:hypothetical protein
MLLACRGYDADWISEPARQQGAWANIPPKRNRKDPICFGPYLYRARNLAFEGLCESALTGTFRAGREARIRRQEAFEEIFCPDHCVSVVGERTSEVSPAP